MNGSNETKIIIWQNPRPSSTRFCRPIRLQFKHESTDTIMEEKNYIEQQIMKLTPSCIIVNNYNINVQHHLVFTMIDGKVYNAISSVTSAQRCYLCKATIKDFNNLDKILKLPVDENSLQFGQLSLHTWIRFFETLLHLSYKLGTKNCQARKEDDKINVEKRKKAIQSLFKSELSLIVDKPK